MSHCRCWQVHPTYVHDSGGNRCAALVSQFAQQMKKNGSNDFIRWITAINKRTRRNWIFRRRRCRQPMIFVKKILQPCVGTRHYTACFRYAQCTQYVLCPCGWHCLTKHFIYIGEEKKVCVGHFKYGCFIFLRSCAHIAFFLSLYFLFRVDHDTIFTNFESRNDASNFFFHSTKMIIRVSK